LGTKKNIPSKALEMGVCFHMGSLLGDMGGGTFLSWDLREKGKFSLFVRRKFIEEFRRRVKDSCGNGATICIGSPLGNLEAVCLPRLFRDR
jgi:hypothetical protein